MYWDALFFHFLKSTVPSSYCWPRHAQGLFCWSYYCTHSQNTCRQWLHSVYNKFSPHQTHLLIAILIYLIQILTLLIFLVNTRFFLSRKIAVFALFWLKQHCLSIKTWHFSLFAQMMSNLSFCRFTYLCYRPQVYS